MELRKDYILNRWTYISPHRSKRPHQYKERQEIEHPKDCPFCPGHENLTPAEIGRIEDERGNWQIRWIPNKYPALEFTDKQEVLREEKFYSALAPYGLQEVIIETPTKDQMADFSCKHIAKVLEVYRDRILALSQVPGIGYVMVFKNKGRGAGASLIHSHSQIMAVGKMPALIEAEIKAFNKYPKCPYCEVVKKEALGPRKAFENEDFLAFCPYAPRFNYEIWLFPKKHFKSLENLGKKELLNLAELFKKILKRLKEINAPYCFYLQYGPPNSDFHFHFELLPRLNVRAGFELSGGDSVVSVSPEEAAEFYLGNKVN